MDIHLRKKRACSSMGQAQSVERTTIPKWDRGEGVIPPQYSSLRMKIETPPKSGVMPRNFSGEKDSICCLALWLFSAEDFSPVHFGGQLHHNCQSQDGANRDD
jgi:hypothetical protein